jgi:hypothetical protein
MLQLCAIFSDNPATQRLWACMAKNKQTKLLVLRTMQRFPNMFTLRESPWNSFELGI